MNNLYDRTRQTRSLALCRSDGRPESLPVALLCAFALLILLGSTDALAQDNDPQIFTFQQARSEFLEAGYVVDKPSNWTLASTGTTVTTFDVWSTGQEAFDDGRLTMVLVFPTIDSARLHRSLAEDREAATARAMLSEDLGPHLVPGYGFSHWQGNLAVIETTRSLRQQWFVAADDLNPRSTAELALPEVSEQMLQLLAAATPRT
jgi:hypothetical protein